MSKTFPLVTVVIPVYNHEKYVKQALTSVWEQSYPRIEIIIIDDGSSDKSCSMVEEQIHAWQQTTSEKKISFIKQSNQGAHATINRGLALANGEFLTILNSDDYYSPRRLEIIVQELQQQKAEWAFTGVHGIDQSGNPLPLDHYWKVWYEKNVWSSCINLTIGFQLLQDNLVVSTGNLFFSRSIYEKVGEFNHYKLAHDLDYALRAVLYAEPLFIQEKLYSYRIHETNTLHQVNHLVDQEKKEIYRNYLMQISDKIPENTVAPCHWFWPVVFPKFRNDLGMDKGFFSDLLAHKREDTKIAPSEGVNISARCQKTKSMTLITHTLCLSGAPKVVLDLAILLKSRGHKVNIISIWDGPLRKEFENRGITVYSIPEKLRFWYSPRTKIKKIYNLAQLLLVTFFRTKNTVICNCAVSWRILFPLVLFSPFRKFYWYIHDSFSPSFMIDPGLAMKLFQRIKDKSNLKAWFGSDSTRKIWEEGIKGKVKYWSGIPKQNTPPPEKTNIKNILSVGSVNPRKAPHHLIDAFIDCVERNRIPKDISLTIIGFDEIIGDTYLYELLLKKNKSGLYERINFVKQVEASELQPFYENADLYIQTSVVECLPLALLQAMSLGLPIITTDVNGCSEAIEHGKTGYVSPARNMKALADAIVHAINNPVQSYKLGLNAQQKFNAVFSLENTQEEILNEL